MCAAASAATSPDIVLTFWFGDEWRAGGAAMESAEYAKRQTRRWFMGGPTMDAQAQPFAPLIRAAARDELTGAAWSGRDGLVARLVLLDQLSRNCFRGTDEAYAYDDAAQRVAASLLSTPAALELPSPAALFLGTCLMHSEDVGLHERCAAYLEAHVARSRSPMLVRQLEGELPAHTAVLRRFGRYPHRNGLQGRPSTAEEVAWLQSAECPGWARSQQAAAAARATPPEPPADPAAAAAAPRMRDLISVDSRGARAALAPLAGRARAEWPEWRCPAYPASDAGRFEESRWWEAAGRRGAAEERCLVTSGRATLWPHGGDGDDGLGPIEIGAGDWVVFRRGFLCTWVVSEPMAKRYAYFTEVGEEMP